jgi:hypothetical protein
VFPVSVQEKLPLAAVTVSVSVDVAWVRVPSVAWIVKLNVPAAVLPKVTVNGAPVFIGVTCDGVTMHVAGAPDEHDRLTLLLYPSIAVTVPFQVTF